MSTENQSPPDSATPSLDARGAARRRLTKAGLGAASVLWTVESRAGMQPMACFSPSAGYSGKLSSNYQTSSVCDGKSPGYWKNHDGWPCKSSTPFAEVFACNGGNQQTFGTKTLLQVVRGCDFDKYNLAMHLVSTYLNVLSGKISFLSPATLKNMWTQLQSNGYYSPAKGVFWSAEQTKKYLEATHD